MFAFGIMLLFGFIVFLVGIALYVIHALALMKMATNRNIDNAWLAFIPFANFYIIGLLVGKQSLAGYEIDKPEFVLPLAALGGFMLTGLPLIGFFFSVVSIIAATLALFWIYKLYIPESAVLYTILSIVIFVTAPFLLWSIKDREPQIM